MNEIGPHHNWAEKVVMRAQTYGVVENDASYLSCLENRNYERFIWEKTTCFR